MLLNRLILAFGLLFSVSGFSHDFFLSITQIEYNQEAQTFEVSIKLTGHDLEFALEESGAPRMLLGAQNEHPEADAYILKYLKGNVQFTINGTKKAFVYVGKEVQDDDDVWIYLEVKEVSKPTHIQIRNAILSDYFVKQQNHVHLKIFNETRSTVLMNGEFEDVLYNSKNNERMKLVLTALTLLMVCAASAQHKFKQLKEELATPNVYRTASGAPGHEYYQQKANYTMNIELDDEKQIVRGEETITYYNYSPDALEYLWIQLDQNMRAKDSNTKKVASGQVKGPMTFSQLKRLHNEFDGGFNLEYVKDKSGKDLSYTVNKTMMRINLKTPLSSQGSFSIKIKWWYNINNRAEIGGRVWI